MSRSLRPRRSAAPRALALAGCVVSGALALATLAGCGDAPTVRVVNASGRRLDGAWIVGEADSVHVPALAPGESVVVSPRVSGEDMILLRGTASGARIDSWEGSYVESSGGYRFRAVVDSALHATIQFVRLEIADRR